MPLRSGETRADRTFDTTFDVENPDIILECQVRMRFPDRDY